MDMNETPESPTFEHGAASVPPHPFSESPNIVVTYFQKLRVRMDADLIKLETEPTVLRHYELGVKQLKMTWRRPV